MPAITVLDRKPYQGIDNVPGISVARNRSSHGKDGRSLQDIPVRVDEMPSNVLLEGPCLRLLTVEPLSKLVSRHHRVSIVRVRRVPDLCLLPEKTDGLRIPLFTFAVAPFRTDPYGLTAPGIPLRYFSIIPFI